MIHPKTIAARLKQYCRPVLEIDFSLSAQEIQNLTAPAAQAEQLSTKIAKYNCLVSSLCTSISFLQRMKYDKTAVSCLPLIALITEDLDELESLYREDIVRIKKRP